MSAARVLNPMLCEFCRVTPSPHALRRKLPNQRDLDHIRKDLFGPLNRIEVDRSFNELMEKEQERAAKRWGFDFRAGVPLNTNPRYIWERVSVQESCAAPAVYTLTRAAHVRSVEPTPITQMDILMDERAYRENFCTPKVVADTDSCDESQDESPTAVFKVPAGTNNAEVRKRQPKITEYMKERKRLAQTPKKLSPAKRIRTSSGSPTTSATHFNNAINANSIAAHFPLRTPRRH